MYKIVRHGPTAISLIRELQRHSENASVNRHKGVIRDRILIQMVNGNAVVLKGSLMLSNKEIADAVKHASVV